MAGRGRGRGRMQVPGENLNLGKEDPPIIMHPPPNYPLMENKPQKTNIDTKLRYLLQLKRVYADYMQESPNNVLPLAKAKDKEWYSDRYKDKSVEKRYDTRYDWSRMPCELKSVVKRKTDQVNGIKNKQRKEVDVDAKLKELENKESTQHSSGEEDEKNNEDKEDEAVEVELEDSDLEMDEGTDYVNSYFDNGENYVDEEDDNADEATF